MKVTALIFASYILMLTMQPVFTVIASAYNVQTEECCGDSCCKHSQQDNKPAKPEQNGMCNPFQSCAACCGYYISESTFNPIIVQQVNSLQTMLSVNFNSEFSKNCFHPPEII